MKKELRKKFKEKRNNIDNRAFYDKKISDLFLSSSLYKQADAILLYSSSGSEVSTDEIFRRCIMDGKKTAFPVCLDQNGLMEFFEVRDDKDLKEGMYGIKEPTDNCQKFIPDENTLCIVPGLSFDKQGYRLGYGKGYYDRYLEKFKGISAGLCCSELLSESLPTDIYDKKVSYLITDMKIYNLNSKEDF